MKDAKQVQIGQMALFAECSPAEIRYIAATADTLDVGPESVLALEGRTVREFFVVVKGVASGDDVVYGPGSFFGETGLLDGSPHRTTIETLTDAKLLVFGPREFRALISHVPSVARVLLCELAGRIREIDQDVASLRAVS